ncbi:MAG: alpha/beta hydrolase [Actinomycetia bacterium]|nr:alpha/beta hydrolase [Actinomycetes bacterium]
MKAETTGARLPRPNTPRMATLPPGRPIVLPDRGIAFVRDAPGPAESTPVVLLHGWAATSDLNWFTSYGTLTERHRVIAMDHRGHGRGIKTSRRFRLNDCADDVAALLDVLEIDKAIIVGYSMGGAVAQLLWRRHPSRVAGMVLCATALSFKETAKDRMMFAAASPTAALVKAIPTSMRRNAAIRIMTGRQDRDIRQWALAEVANHRWVRVLEAGSEIGSFDSRRWIGSLDVPAAQVLTLDDDVITPDRQQAVGTAVPHATLHLVPGGHAAVIDTPDRFVPALARAVRTVDCSVRESL